ncbi:MAG: NAD(P)/FAD-dependent oxidoreductase [Chloroflexi bacterium]|nr:NAD(P)/FAD-dependent oxidoreductase [Chloroflexota bacterium]
MATAPPEPVVDVMFIGAGPSGLFGAFYAGLREMSVRVIDNLPQAGGQLTALYPEKLIYDVPGHPAILARDLVTNLLWQAQKWNPAIGLAERATTLTQVPLPGGAPHETCWRIETDKGNYLTRAVIITAGIGAFEPIRLNNDSILPFEGKGVAYLASDLNAYAGKRVLIVGGGDSAVDWALALGKVAREVTLIHRREGFRAHDASVNALQASKVDVRLFHEIRVLQGKGRLERAVIFDNRTQAETTLEVDEAILALGFKADLGPIREWGVETVGRRYVKVNSRMETNLPGVYAAGDITSQEGVDPLNLIVVGLGQVTVAVNYAYARIKPGGKVFPGHSSERAGGGR